MNTPVLDGFKQQCYGNGFISRVGNDNHTSANTNAETIRNNGNSNSARTRVE